VTYKTRERKEVKVPPVQREKCRPTNRTRRIVKLYWCQSDLNPNPNPIVWHMNGFTGATNTINLKVAEGMQD